MNYAFREVMCRLDWIYPSCILFPHEQNKISFRFFHAENSHEPIDVKQGEKKMMEIDIDIN